MLAGYILSKSTGLLCLQIVYELASVSVRDCYPTENPANSDQGMIVLLINHMPSPFLSAQHMSSPSLPGKIGLGPHTPGTCARRCNHPC